MTEDEMGFLILSEGGDGFGLALRLEQEGHKVSMWIRDGEAEKRGENLITKGSHTEFNPLVVADCTGAGSLMDIYKDSGALTFGGSREQDKLESDREYSSSIFKKSKIKEPDSQEFTSWGDAEAFIQSAPDDTRLVFKPCGKLSGNLPSYVSHDNEELLRMLNHFRNIVGESDPHFVLQEFIPGTCISSEAWFQKDRFIRPFNHTLERKQLMNDDLGPSGGCTGNVVWTCNEEDCPICESLLKLEDYLKEVEYLGPIDINSVIGKDGNIYALEFTPRMGYDAFPTLLYGLFEGDFGRFIYECSKSSFDDPMPLRSSFAAGVRISIPPWPSEDFHSNSGIPIRGLRKGELGTSFYPYEVSRVEDELVTSGGWGIVGICVGRGNTIEEAFEEATKLAERLRIPDKQYRTDLVETFKTDVRRISRSLGVSV